MMLWDDDAEVIDNDYFVTIFMLLWYAILLIAADAAQYALERCRASYISYWLFYLLRISLMLHILIVFTFYVTGQISFSPSRTR
jgi:hypothetical protein